MTETRTEVQAIVLPGVYRDSVFLMKLSSRARELSGAGQISAIMATSRNKDLLSHSGLLTPEIESARPDDLVVAIEAAPGVVASAQKTVLDLLNSPPRAHRSPTESLRPKSLPMAVERLGNAGIAMITVAGEYAKYEAAQALSAGLDVFLYSDNVGIEDELALKRLASQKGKLLMGPDCGTAVVADIPLGFANRMRQGTVGIVSTTGTGLQEVGCLLDRCGLGVSCAYGVGGRDMNDYIGGLSTLTALSRMATDPRTHFIVVIGQFPGEETRRRLIERYLALGKPVLARYIGVEDYSLEDDAGILHAATLTQAVTMTVERIASVLDTSDLLQPAPPRRRPATNGGGYVRGMFSGGTYCYEAMEICLPRLDGEVYSNVAMRGAIPLSGFELSRRHTFLDMGSDEFTVGRPHPLLYPEGKLARIVGELCDPDTSVVLTDVILGSGVAANYASLLVQAVDKAAALTRGKSREKTIVVNVCGTEGDAPGRSSQIDLLRKSGIIVLGNNAQAAAYAAELVGGP